MRKMDVDAARSACHIFLRKIDLQRARTPPRISRRRLLSKSANESSPLWKLIHIPNLKLPRHTGADSFRPSDQARSAWSAVDVTPGVTAALVEAVQGRRLSSSRNKPASRQSCRLPTT
jgi:hypothetical protein